MDCITGTEIGAYRLDHEVGQGGMSSVYAARHRFSGAPVAIKVLHRESLKQPEMALRFLQEANVCARMEHANLVPVYQVGKTKWGLPFMVMELLEGEDLQTLLERRPRLPWFEASQLMRQLLTGLAVIHAHGVVHRDVKPENCFLHQREGRTELKLLDFGIAQPPTECRACKTGATLILGTPNYMAPEQARGRTVDGRADLYGASVMFFRLLSGRLPYSGESPADVIAQHLRAPIPSLFDAEPDLPVPREFDRFLLKALAKHPSGRFNSAKEMLRALDNVVRAAATRGTAGAGPRVAKNRDGGQVIRLPVGRAGRHPANEVTRRIPAASSPPRPRQPIQKRRLAGVRALLAAAVAAVTFYGVGEALEVLDSWTPEMVTSELDPYSAVQREGARGEVVSRSTSARPGRSSPGAG